MHDRAYRNFLNAFYERHGFDVTRVYRDIEGREYTTIPCFYCGVPATCEDHTMPLVACVELVKEDRMDKKRYWLVPSCHECKGILKDKIFPRMEQRKRYVKKRLRARYRKYLQVPQWDGHEIAELGDGLRAYVVQGEIKKHIIEDRLVWW